MSTPAPRCSCIICHKDQSSKGIHSHYIISHTTEANNRTSNKGRILVNTKGQQIALEKQVRYTNNPNKCTHCDNNIEYKYRNNKFCSRSCSAIYINKSRVEHGYVVTKEHKHKTSLTLKNKPQKQKQKQCMFPPPPKICTYCNNKHIRNGKSCSYECELELHRIGGRKSASIRNKRSKDEIRLFNLISTHYICIPNHIISDGWDADIFIPSLNTAIFWNGPWHYKEMNIKGHSLIQVQNRDKIKTKLFKSIGVSVLVYEDRYFTPETALDTFLNWCNERDLNPQ